MAATRKKAPAKRGRPPAKKANGRPIILTDDLQDRLCEALRTGCYVETAAAYCGIHKDTFYDWLRRGARERRRRDDGKDANASEARFMRFSDAVKAAVASADLRDIATISKASQKQWQAAAWRLERRYPQLWGRRSIEPNDGVTVTLTREQLMKTAAGEDDDDNLL